MTLHIWKLQSIYQNAEFTMTAF